MSELEDMEAAVERLRAEEDSMTADRERLREALATAQEALRDHSKGFKMIRDARAELERRIVELETDPRPVSEKVDALINSITAAADSNPKAPAVDILKLVEAIVAEAESGAETPDGEA